MRLQAASTTLNNHRAKVASLWAQAQAQRQTRRHHLEPSYLDMAMGVDQDLVDQEISNFRLALDKHTPLSPAHSSSSSSSPTTQQTHSQQQRLETNFGEQALARSQKISRMAPSRLAKGGRPSRSS